MKAIFAAVVIGFVAVSAAAQDAAARMDQVVQSYVPRASWGRCWSRAAMLSS